MEIIIEIGTEEEKFLIQKELSSIATVVKELEPPVPLNQIIVPSDFQAKINSLEGVDTYESIRGFGSNIIAVLAKIAKVEEIKDLLVKQITGSVKWRQTTLFMQQNNINHIKHLLIKSASLNFDIK